ncbi:uncharacterized protein MONOS_13983 [Monocercomonoides exilis]|uniref:uncharacterized protein n=1 Tax=Monocercomonoides exilis TaxID=2049356 RepID=UPI00355ABDE7|nr:hypothetical protein MONOS_13983 [Monocercomonoides exilis]|eukprot:MONOS_13983.1-p1 / transcript=MONOS_13983.1 / gene=MONOS_13983 / organism=Monocercomonoides_exilis_PA203 / gene_product=unspecified product / transcript_product=unspecified product / location=Mono_scaffold00917:3039-3476(+) / protein_length=146 / sequence_SO=supercontig / SO=protein_coding / is_pseudo=false
MRRNSLKESKKKQETECLSVSSIINDEEQRKEKRHKQREKQRLMRKYYQALELQSDSVVNEVLLMVRPNLLFSPALIDKSRKRPGINENAAKSEGDDKEDEKKEKEVNNPVNVDGNKEEEKGYEENNKDATKKDMMIQTTMKTKK